MIQKVISNDDILITAKLALCIWNEHYVPMIGQEQVDYMIKNFQSPEVIENQINHEDYEYFIIYHQSLPSGYIAIKQRGNELFLSKFYVIKEKRGTGLGREGMDFIALKGREFGAGKITLTVNKNNVNSIKAYEKLGFTNDGPVVTDIGNGYVMDDFKMSKQL